MSSCCIKKVAAHVLIRSPPHTMLFTMLLCWSCHTMLAAANTPDTCSNPPLSYFPDIPHIPYEGPTSRNPLAFRYYNRDEVVYGKPMREWLRFSLAFWHTMRGDGSDMFGSATRVCGALWSVCGGYMYVHTYMHASTHTCMLLGVCTCCLVVSPAAFNLYCCAQHVLLLVTPVLRITPQNTHQPTNQVWPWEDASLGPVDQAKMRLDAFFELLDKLGGVYGVGGVYAPCHILL